MRSLLIAPFALFVALAAAACADDPELLTAEPIPAEGFMAAYAKAICERGSRCFVVTSALDAACDDAVRNTFGEDVEDAIAAGRIVYDADAAGQCVAGIAATDCLADQPSDETNAACLHALSGTIARGEPCFGTFQCAEGICPSVTGDQCPTVCPEAAKKDEACSLLGGPFCDVRAGLSCSAGVCVTPVGAGALCTDNFACRSGLVCVEGACAPLRGNGQGCSKDSACKPGHFCVAEGDEGGVCRPRVPAGGACANTTPERNASFRHAQCADGLVCLGAGVTNDGTNIPGTCAASIDLGGDCDVEPDGLQVYATGCKDGIICVAGKCAQAPAVGEACGTHYECLSIEAYCDPMTVQCSTPKANGEACTIDRECSGGFCGSGGTCTDLDTYCGP